MPTFRSLCTRNDVERAPYGPSSSPRMRASSTPRLIDSIIDISGILGRPVKPGDDKRVCVRDLATFIARGLHLFVLSHLEGAGKTGCLLHPRSRVPFARKEKRTRAY